MVNVVDTTIMVDILRGNASALALLKELSARCAYLYASEISRAEILAGARPKESENIESFFKAFNWIDIDENISRTAGALASQYQKSHSGITMEDYMVAATAQNCDAALVTLNIKDFPVFPELERPY